MKISGRSSYKPGSSRDECSSPPYSIMTIIDQIELYRRRIGAERRDFIILEPALGMSGKHHYGIMHGFESFGYRVLGLQDEDFTTVSFDEVNKQSEFFFDSPIHMIVTNPPFSVSLKRKFIRRCDEIRNKYKIPWALLMLGVTHHEKLVREIMSTTSIHVPYGRINFGMPNKGWGTPEHPTKSTFATAWYTKGIVQSNQVMYDDFDMSNHFKALEVFDGLNLGIRYEGCF